MKNKLMILSTIISLSCNAETNHKSSGNPLDFISSGYTVFEKSVGDLNNDNQDDYVFVIKGTDKSNFVHDEQRGELDRNRRGIIVILKNENKYNLIAENLDCFSSENEDDGVYFAPELDVSITKGKLDISYSHGRYGFWSYTFRFQHSKLELIGYDSSENRGPVIERVTSINFSTKKMLIKENKNFNAEGGDEQFKETWTKIRRDKLIDLEEIKDFDELYRDNLLEMVQTSKN
jgi:hypothetical protein